MRGDVELAAGADKVLAVVALVAPTVLRCSPARRASISRAAVRSAVPVASVSRVSMASLLRLSISTWPMKDGRASAFFDLVNSRESGSVVLAWVSLLRFWRLKSTSGLLLLPVWPGGGPTFGTKLLSEAQVRTQRTVHAEMLRREQLACFGLVHHAFATS